jgi:glycosyltransferase involved in cell wall biosynthesis
MTGGPTFSVIVPTYNRAELIQRTLKTIFDQRRAAHEIIVVDDCSTDETENVLRPLVEQGRITFIRHERNLERAAARNTGMAHATGDFVTFLDSDDLMYPDNLADAAAFVRRFPEARLFHNFYEHVAPDGSLFRRWRFPSITDPLSAIADGNFMSCIGNFVHRDLYRDLRFDDDLVASEDWEFWMRAIARAGLGRIPKFNSALVHHRGRSVLGFELDSVSRRLDRLTAKVEGDPELSRAYRRHIGRIRASSFLFLASAANSSGRQKEARRFLAEAVRARPASIRRGVFVRIAVRATVAPSIWRRLT